MPISNLATLTIERVIIHDVPKHLRSGSAPGPTLSEVVSPLSGDLPTILSEKIKEAIGGQTAFDVVEDPAATSPVRGLVGDLLRGIKRFVRYSQQMAQHLHSIQTGVNPGGLLAVIECRMGTRTAFAILKLEREEGVRIAQSIVNGKRTFNLGHIRDLILTEKTKLFKIALFVLDKHGRVEGAACDQQRGFLPRTEIASFFLSSFLGCRLRLEPSISTKHFFESSEDFINQAVSDPIDRRTYHTHLLSELASNRTAIDPTAFANTYLNTGHRQPFLDHLSQGDIPVQPFPKDNHLIKTRLKTTVMEFQSGIQIVGPETAIKEKVSMKKTDDTAVGEGKVQATIIDRLKRIRNR